MVASGVSSCPTRAPSATDPLDAVLACVRWNVSGYRSAARAAGTVLHRDDDERGRFLLVQSGRVEVRARALGDLSPTVLEPGNYLLLPRGGTSSALVLDDAVLHEGDLEADSADAVRLVQVMPPALIASCLLVRDPFVGEVLRQMVRETAGGRPGAASVVTALANVVTTAAVRVWAETGCGSADVLRGFALDDDVSRALTAMHDDPGADWTVERLARLAFASRSSFAERFREVVGDTPVRYLARYRMEEAKRLLRTRQESVTDVAARLGYSSDAAFIRAFRRHTGEAPGAWRQRPAVRPDSVSSAPPAMAATAPTV
jgi:AraC-like DNA-binding protein